MNVISFFFCSVFEGVCNLIARPLNYLACRSVDWVRFRLFNNAKGVGEFIARRRNNDNNETKLHGGTTDGLL